MKWTSIVLVALAAACSEDPDCGSFADDLAVDPRGSDLDLSWTQGEVPVTNVQVLLVDEDGCEDYELEYLEGCCTCEYLWHIEDPDGLGSPVTYGQADGATEYVEPAELIAGWEIELQVTSEAARGYSGWCDDSVRITP